MTKNRPHCPVCAGKMKKNGTTSKGTTRWRCTDPSCGASSVRQTQQSAKNAATFRQFYSWITSTQSLESIANSAGTTRQSLHHRFSWCWLIQPQPFIDTQRIYDQVFIDGTYLNKQCLLIMSTIDHVIAWHWCTTENTHSYIQLLTQIRPPLIVTLDGGQGAYSAICSCWPETKIQRCTVHIQRRIRHLTTSRPRTDAGKAIYAHALALTKVSNREQAAHWVVNLHDIERTFAQFLNEKTFYAPDQHRRGKSWEWTHQRDRKALNSLKHVYRQGWLFTWLEPPQGFHGQAKSTTNSLEGGINSPLKLLARTHRGMTREHQRTIIDWWLLSHTQLPDDPIDIARQQRWGQDALAKVSTLSHNENHADQETGRPALYDNAIPTDYQHNIGIRQGTIS